MTPTGEINDNNFSKPIRYLRGIGPQRAEIFQKLGISTIGDLLHFYPRRYEDRSLFCSIKDIQPGNMVTIRGHVLSLNLKRIPRMPIFEMLIGDDSGFIHAAWFNQVYLKRQFKTGDQVILHGKADLFNKRLQLSNPDYEKLTGTSEDTIHTGRIVPVYPLTEGLGQRGLRRAAKLLLDDHHHAIEDDLPGKLRAKLGLMERKESVRNIHFPDSLELLAKAKERLIFEEFFIFELALLKRIHAERNVLKAYPLPPHDDLLGEFRKTVPFTLTGSQEQVIREIAFDLAKASPMRRLLQGDVGSGKTVVAAFLIIVAAKAGLQSALMAPTEVLAEQHYETLSKLLAPFQVRIALLTGSIAENEKNEILADLRNHRKDVIVGTHALIQDGVRFAKLGFVVIDEQHKFGVRQRAKLLAGNMKPHLLVMTATPIPRTLGLTLYGDLDISVLTELPAGRRPIRTFWIVKDREKEILGHLREKAADNEQSYIIFPIIDETQNADLLAAKKEYERLSRDDLKGLSVGLIHGRMDKQERDRVMKDFRENKTKVLVATSVIEVGIDNPNATLMVIEHAERFGLSQLHQLRGRIGRGRKDSVCFLFGEPTTDEGKKRLRILTKTQDGFVIAEEDLRLRGPGNFLGTRQSGEPFFKIGDIVEDAQTLILARKEALSFLESDPSFHEAPRLLRAVEKETAALQSLERTDGETKEEGG